MTYRIAPRSIERLSGLGAALFALGFALSPALAATGADTRCDQSVDSAQMPDAHNNNLTLEVVDHMATDSLAAGQLSIDSALEDGGSAAPSTDDPPRVEALLRKIFDETQLYTPEVSSPEDVDERSAPLAVNKTDNGEEQTPSGSRDVANEIAPRLPGVSGDELLRFKQQMYRTDI